MAWNFPGVHRRSSVVVSLAVAVLAAGVTPSLADVGDLVDRTIAAVDRPAASPDGVETYRASWVHSALTLQRALDAGAPLAEATIVHTHNSFNSSAYDPTLTNQDPNQIYSLTDQLDMDVRALELDVHWVPSPHGSPATGGRWVTLCHGNSDNPLGVHVGCTVDRPLDDGLREIRAWLDDPAHASEVVLLYLENQLGDEALAHTIAGSIVRDELGSLVYRPPASAPCTPMEWSTTRAAILAADARVVIVGNCDAAIAGATPWGALVHPRGSRWNEGGDPSTYDLPSPQCAADRAARLSVPFGGGAFRRYFEDSTWVAAAAGSNPVTSSFGGTSTISTTGTAAMVRCGVNIVGFDQLTPEDPRLAAMVWSWAPDALTQPARAGHSCAYQGADARWHADSCRTKRRAACTSDGGGFVVSPKAVRFDQAPRACAALSPTLRFAAPVNGLRNQLLAELAKPSPDVWVNASL